MLPAAPIWLPRDGPAIGIDLGGTKIEGVVLDATGTESCRHRIATPRGNYTGTITAIASLVATLERNADRATTIGVGIPGSQSPATGNVQNANSVWLNGRPFATDLETALGRPIRLANDANCFALSEATDGAAAGTRSVLGVILGTGCGSGIVRHGRLVDGPNGIGGEWGHNPLPWATADEHPGPRCWCGRLGCIETWVSGPGLAADHLRVTDVQLDAAQIAAAARAGDHRATATLTRHASRLARGLAMVINIVDPDVIVLGGGLSQLDGLYRELPGLIAEYVFADRPKVSILPPRWGDSSGVRGAARLWQPDALPPTFIAS